MHFSGESLYFSLDPQQSSRLKSRLSLIPCNFQMKKLRPRTGKTVASSLTTETSKASHFNFNSSSGLAVMQEAKKARAAVRA
jgi:hypothetical protein